MIDSFTESYLDQFVSKCEDAEIFIYGEIASHYDNCRSNEVTVLIGCTEYHFDLEHFSVEAWHNTTRDDIAHGDPNAWIKFYDERKPLFSIPAKPEINCAHINNQSEHETLFALCRLIGEQLDEGGWVDYHSIDDGPYDVGCYEGTARIVAQLVMEVLEPFGHNECECGAVARKVLDEIAPGFRN